MMLSCAGAVLGGALLALSFPLYQVQAASWVAFVPLLWAIDRAGRPGVAAVCGFAFGCAFFLMDLTWIYRTLLMHGHFGPAAATALLVAMVLTLALFPALFACTASWLASRGFALGVSAPLVWTVLEYVRGQVVPVFPWDLAGYGQAANLRLMQLTDITGIYGVSALIVLVNSAIWTAVRQHERKGPMPLRFLLMTAVTVIAVFVYGHVRLTQHPPHTPQPADLRVGVLQANIPQEKKWEPSERESTFLIYERLGTRAVTQGAELLIWAETSVPVLYGSDNRWWKRPRAISETLGVPMLVGGPAARSVNGVVRYYNSAFLVEGTVIPFRYDKIRLVPFGEYVPLSWLIPFGQGLAAREQDYSPGARMTVMQSDAIPPFSVLICYEAIFDDLARRALSNGAQWLVNITNDGWFGGTAAPYQHLAMARTRSVENRTWFVRCANTGVSAVFDPAGRRVAHKPLEEPGVIVAAMPRNPGTGSFYSRFGNIFVALSAAGTVLLMASAMYSGRAFPRHAAGPHKPL